jgi:hypothetical protein
VIGTGDQPAARALLADLAATPEMIAGAASASLAMQPVALTLGELSAFLGCPREAAGYFRTALRVARAWNAPRWAARAEAALAGVADEGAADA